LDFGLGLDEVGKNIEVGVEAIKDADAEKDAGQDENDAPEAQGVLDNPLEH
jgi:hypothetical protein